jgi:predicted nucleotidyltransferase
MDTRPTDHSKLRQLRDELCSALKQHYGARLRGMFLFGSWARGEPDSESDVDILVVLTEMNRYGREIEETSDIVASISLSHGLSICMIFVRELDWRSADTPFLQNVREEAIPA